MPAMLLSLLLLLLLIVMGWMRWPEATGRSTSSTAINIDTDTTTTKNSNSNNNNNNNNNNNHSTHLRCRTLALGRRVAQGKYQRRLVVSCHGLAHEPVKGSRLRRDADDRVRLDVLDGLEKRSCREVAKGIEIER